ncbi:hypothetical protein J6590_031151, partial [Homalodisca vitripennis]
SYLPVSINWHQSSDTSRATTVRHMGAALSRPQAELPLAETPPAPGISAHLRQHSARLHWRCTTN